MKKLIPIVLLFIIVFILLAGGNNTDTSSPEDNLIESVARELAPGEVFEKNCYIEFENVKFTYDGEGFIIENNSDSIMLFSCGFYGAKSDGTYEFIGTPAFSGLDEVQYEKDLAENGWAIKKSTNRVRPGESITASLTIFDFGEDYPAWDIDNDGYYDIKFSLAKQKDETSVQVSTSDPESAYYKLKAVD